jgi:hypothetical protein
MRLENIYLVSRLFLNVLPTWNCDRSHVAEGDSRQQNAVTTMTLAIIVPKFLVCNLCARGMYGDIAWLVRICDCTQA